MADQRLASNLPFLLFFLLFFFVFGSSSGQLNSYGEFLTLLELRHALGLRTHEWPIKKDPCSEWKGVRCNDNGSVSDINISGFKRTRVGKQNPRFEVDALANLTNLVSFNASRFSLPGSIPAWFGNRTSKLQVLDLSSCSISGALPVSFGNLTNLRVLNLSDNSLNGSIPSTLQQLSGLSTLDLSRNAFSGSIPSSLASLGNLSSLSMSSNSLTGPLPLGIGTLSKLEMLNLSHNNLSSSIPPQLGDLHSLVELDLSSNGLLGSIPSDLSALRNLQILDLGDNRLSGSLPTDLFPVGSELRILIMKENSLGGPVPDVVWSLSKLRVLDLSGNNFTDTLLSVDPGSDNVTSSELSISRNMFYGPLTPLLRRFSPIDVSDNYFEGLVPDYVPANASIEANCLRNAPNQRNQEECSTFYAQMGRRFDNFGQPEPADDQSTGVRSTHHGLSRTMMKVLLAAVAAGIGSTSAFV